MDFYEILQGDNNTLLKIWMMKKMLEGEDEEEEEEEEDEDE